MSYFQENRTLLEHIAHKKQQLREEKKRDYINELKSYFIEIGLEASDGHVELLVDYLYSRGSI